MGGEGDVMSAAMVGGVVVGASLAAATILCTSLCLALWCRRWRGNGSDPSPATFLVNKRKPGQEYVADHPMALVMPTITQSEADSEPRTPTPTTTLTPTSEWPKRSVPPYTSASRPNDLETTNYPRMTTLASPPSYSPLPTYATHHPRTSQRPRSASPRSFLPAAPRTPPLSLPLGARKWPSGTRPSSPLTPGTPPGLPPRTYFRKGVVGLEDLRAALYHSFELGGGEALEVSTPDSIEGWAPVWTPASSIGSGGGCGLGEVRLRLRYTVRTRLLHLLLYSADQLPHRLGPDPVATYAKAVLLPEKRVRFTTPWVAATDTAVFNASFTHPTRPSRLAHSTLRLSVCQVLEVTGCGRRVVVGYCAVNLSSIGMRSGLTTDIDTGLLALHLQETAPDQQVGVGGQLKMGLKWDTEAGVLIIRISCISGLQLLHLQPPLQDNAQAYVKVTVYVNNTILCWRRSKPQPVAAVVEVEEDLSLYMPELDLDATHLVFSVRLRTRPGCGRRVVGSCLVGRGGCVGEDGHHHWEDMLKAAPDFVNRTHPLTAHHDPAALSICHDSQEWRQDVARAASPHFTSVSDSATSDYPTVFTSSAISSRPLILPSPRRAFPGPPDPSSFPTSHSTPLSSSSALTLTTTTTTLSNSSALNDSAEIPISPPVRSSSSTSLSSPSALTSPSSIPSGFASPDISFSGSPPLPSSSSAFIRPSSILNSRSGDRSCNPPLPDPAPPRTPSPTAASTPRQSPTLPSVSVAISHSPTFSPDTTLPPNNTPSPTPHSHLQPPPPPPAPPPSPSQSRPISQHNTL